jgi:uncharacterized protein (DUF1684 family)
VKLLHDKKEQAMLTLFSDPHGFLLPFVDALAGKATYGAGRYLEPEPLPNGRLLVDFKKLSEGDWAKHEYK